MYIFVTVWLRHAFPFELLSNADSFLYVSHDDHLQLQIDQPEFALPNQMPFNTKASASIVFQNSMSFVESTADMVFETQSLPLKALTKDLYDSTIRDSTVNNSTDRSSTVNVSSMKSSTLSGSAVTSSSVTVRPLSSSLDSPNLEKDDCVAVHNSPHPTSNAISDNLRTDGYPETDTNQPVPLKRPNFQEKLIQKVKALLPKHESNPSTSVSVTKEAAKNSHSSIFDDIKARFKLTPRLSPRKQKCPSVRTSETLVIPDILPNDSVTDSHETACNQLFVPRSSTNTDRIVENFGRQELSAVGTQTEKDNEPCVCERKSKPKKFVCKSQQHCVICLSFYTGVQLHITVNSV